MKEQLELKHLNPYGINPLRVMLSNHQVDLVTCLDYEHSVVETLNNGACLLKDVKPILRPLSDLTKEITHNEETFVPMVELLKIAHKEYYKEHEGTRYGVVGFEENGWYQKAWFKFMATKDIEIHTGFIWNEQQWKIQKLHEWHFDTENLIEKGLAYDINKLEQNVN